MNVLIVEDENIAAKKLKKLLLEIDNSISVMAITSSIKESVKWLSNNKADLIFLDIQLSDGVSFSIFDDLEISTPIIFTTAYDQYAIKAFELNSISYLLKPIRKKDLEIGLNKFSKLKSSLNTDFENLLGIIQNNDKAYKKRFLVQIGDKIIKVETNDIAYIYAKDKAVYIHTFEGRTRTIDYTLDKLEQVLDPEIFYRINRNLIVNINSISDMFAYSRSRVKLNLLPKGGEFEEAVVSIDRSSDFKNWINS